LARENLKNSERRFPRAWIFIAWELYQLVSRSHAPADRVMADYFRGKRGMGARDRRFVAETVYGMIRKRAILDFYCECSAPRPREFERVEIYLCSFARDVAAEAPIEEAHRERYERATHEARAQLRKMDKWERLSIETSIPLWLILGWVEKLDAVDIEALARSLAEPAPTTVRVNTLKGDRPQVAERLATEEIATTPGALSPLALTLAKRVGLGSIAAFRDGLFEMQDEGSQLIAPLTKAQPGQLIVDACAGGGGKTLQLAAMMQNKGMLYAFDNNEHRLTEIAPRARRAGVHNIRAKVVDSPTARDVTKLRGKADAVLIDAPCSGTGTFRRNPDASAKITPDRISELCEIQAKLLDGYSALVRPGGRLVYATCSLERSENEAQVEAFLERHPEFTLDSAAPVVGAKATRGGYLRLFPHIHNTDGFFAAVLVRNAE
jgi:16S rRNA (cytosine967-C5)-methyltransferase